MKHKGNDFLIMSLYADDLLVIGNDIQVVEEFKQEMMQAFEMTDLGLMTYYLGMEIKAGRKRSIRLLKEVCKGNIEEISDERMQGYQYTHESKGKAELKMMVLMMLIKVPIEA